MVAGYIEWYRIVGKWEIVEISSEVSTRGLEHTNVNRRILAQF